MSVARALVHENAPTLALGHPLFQGMPEAVAQQLLRDAATLHAQSGEILFDEGADALEYLYVCRGEVEVLRQTREGLERVFHIFRPGQLLAETAMFMSHGRYPMTARARGDVVVFCFKRTGLLLACHTWPQLAMRLLERLSDRVYHRINEIEWFSDSTAAQRLADYLLHLAGEDRRVSLPISQRQLAMQLGIRPETLSRLLADWVAQGVISGARRRWQLVNSGFLDSLARPVRRSF